MMIWAKLARLTKHHILKPIDHIETAGDANEASRTLPKRNETEKKTREIVEANYISGRCRFI